MYQDSDDKTDHWCAFSREIQNQDAGSALIMYENGIHASYSQNFLSRRSAYRRSATVVGYEATLEFDLAPMELRIIHHRSEKVEQLRVDIENDGHGGRSHSRRKLPGPGKGTRQARCLTEGWASQRCHVPRRPRVSPDKDLPASIVRVDCSRAGRCHGEVKSNTL
jgi:hypothetical protein